MNEEALLEQMTRIADALERLASGGKITGPNIIRPIEEYKTFDWTAHHIEIVMQDNDGPTQVSYQGTLYTRRSPSNKYAPAIWYSAANGKDDEGNNLYIKLITFRTFGEADPLPAKLNAELRKPAPEPVKKPAQPDPQKKTEPPATNGKRPYTPEILWTKLVTTSAAKQNEQADKAVRTKTLAAIRQCFTGDPGVSKKAEDLLYSVAKVRSIDVIKPGMVLALLAWLNPKADSGGALTISDMVIQEAKGLLEKKS